MSNLLFILSSCFLRIPASCCPGIITIGVAQDTSRSVHMQPPTKELTQKSTNLMSPIYCILTCEQLHETPSSLTTAYV